MPLERAVGLPGLIFIGVGMILGAGIYSVIGTAAGEAGAALWQSFVLAAVVALLSALSYAELATRYPKAGAEYVYLEKAAPKRPWLGVATGILVATSGIATCATVSLAFAGYLGELTGLPRLPVALGLLVLIAGVNLVGIRQVAGVNVAFTLIEAGGLVLLIVVGVGSDRFGEALATPPSLSVAATAALVFFSFLGFENIANLAEEAREPERHVPLAILISLAVATVLYVLVALAALALLPPAQLAASDAPLTAAAAAASPLAARALNIIALFATANTALVSLLVSSRLLYGMADGGSLPARLAALSRRKTPWLAILVCFAVAAALVPLGTVGVIASMSSFAALAAFAAVNGALVVIRWRGGRRHHGFRVPLQLGRLAVLPTLGLVTCLALATQLDPRAILGGLTVLTLGLGGHALSRKSKRSR